LAYPCKSKVLEKLGVRSMINACNWSTVIGGTYLEPRVIEAMADVSSTFLDLRELLKKAGDRIADLCKVDAAYITVGAAAGITLSVAAAIAGNDPVKWETLPFTDDSPISGRNKIIIQATQAAYDKQFAMGGGRLVKVGSPLGSSIKDIELAINDKTAGIAAGYHYNIVPRGWVPYEEVAKIAKKHDLPSFCDCAGAFPPYANLHKLTDAGFDLSIFSGGKGIRGPQNTGIILGDGERGVELIQAISMHSAPNHGIGRGFKVSKECVVGLVTALEIILSRDENEEYEKQMAKAEYMAEQLDDIIGVNVNVIPNNGKTYEHPLMPRTPVVRLDIDKEVLNMKTIQSLYTAMRDGEPGIYLRFPRFEDREFGPFTSHASVLLFTYYLRDGEERIVAKQMKNVLINKPWTK
jgi:L-seryl-tRNA(Ser) seleniumtransferase